jgi:DNA-binding beta-propeller fold protein YncE
MKAGIIEWVKLGCFFIFISISLTTCTYDKEPVSVSESGYPDDIAKIFVDKCATAGCHNTQSKVAAGGFDLSTWNHLFEGGRNGSPVIPYRPDESFLMYFINTYSDLGISLTPPMPVNGDPLSHDEVVRVRNWIQDGAPDKEGNIKFCCDPNRKKFYVPNQGCDEVAVFDAASRVIMRYVHVGVEPIIESPHQVRVSPDGLNWYVVFFAGHVIQKFSTIDDSYVGAIEIGNADWNTISFTPDSKKAYVCSPGTGKVQPVNLETMAAELPTTEGNPHGSYVTQAGYLFITDQGSSNVKRVPVTDPGFNWDVEHLYTTLPSTFLSPHEIAFTPDESKYFVTCQNTDEVRMMKVNYSGTDSLLQVFHVGNKPQEMSVSTTKPYLFVSCMEDSSVADVRGSVYVINYITQTIVGSVHSGMWQPHGLAVDDDNQLVYVANRNKDGGLAPHHSSDCAGRNGFLLMIDMNTLQLLKVLNDDGSTYTYKNELLVDPYFVSIKK